MKVRAIVDFSVTLINGESYKVNAGDKFNLVTTYVAFPSKRAMAVIHKKNTTPFSCYLEQFEILN